jgi:hypothetical protein
MRARFPPGPLVRFARDERGATLLEFGLVLPVFLLTFFALIDFGRMGGEYVMAGKATHLAARLAAVRPPACAGVPNSNLRGTVPEGTVPPRFGTSCNAGATVCANPGVISCAGSAADTTAAEIWGAVAPLMPTGATVANLQFSYAYDPNLGFLGGPYVPIVTVEIQNLNFQYATPVGAFAAMFTGNPAPGQTLPFPPMSVSLPGEDLALGENG